MARKKTRARWGDGQIKQLGENKWLVRASGGTDADGRRLRPAKVVYGTRQAAIRALLKVQDELDAQAYIPPEDMTVGEWLREWFRAQWNAEVGDPESIRQSKYPLRTVETYEGILRCHLIPAVGRVPIQRLRTTHLREYFDQKSQTLAMATLEHHYIIINSALDAAAREGLIRENVAKRMTGKPRGDKSDSPKDVLESCWEADEAQRFLQAAREAGPQWAALFTLALDSGMRKGELCGLQWRDIDWQAGTVTVERTLLRAGREPVFGPVKNRRARTIAIAPETLALLKAHRKHQAEIKLTQLPHPVGDFRCFLAGEERERRGRGCPGSESAIIVTTSMCLTA